MAKQPIDAQYMRNREDLLTYEDARFNSLLSCIPDCYPNLTESTLWGAMLRVLAEELARIEFFLSYDVVSVDPHFLTPPDIKRRYAAPLAIPKTFPTSTETDQDYRALCVDLLAAYMQGGTVNAIQQVIAAYTGDTVPVVELYRLIGNGVYDMSDHNRIQVTVPLVSATPLSATATANRLQTIAQSLFSAIDLIKPAHIYVDYAVSVGGDEELSGKILGIADTFLFIMLNAELSPLEAAFTVSPFIDPSSPDTELTAEGIIAGIFMAAKINAAQWAGLMSNAFRAEYQADGTGNYVFNPANALDVLLTDDHDQVTGEISKAQGVLAPALTTSWIIKSEGFAIYELD
jgi:hypothetical protein